MNAFFPLISPYDVISGLAVFAVSYWIGLCLLRSASCKPVPAEKRWLPVLLLFSGIGAAIFVTAPVAAVAKYQDWCQSFKSCIFHDSRLSYYFTGLAIASGILMSVYRISEGVPSRALRTRSLALLISGFALLTYVHNRSLQYDMADYVSPWDRARRVACLPGPALDDLDPVSLITRGSRISVHPGFDVNSYWRSYLTGIRTSQRCATSTDQLTDMLPQAVPGIAYSFNRGGSGVAFLGNGWSQPEEWGTWSASNEANIVVLPKNHPTRMKLTLSAFIYPPIASQRAQVSINGDVVADLVLTSPVPGTIEISLPPNREERVLNLDFRLPDARSPKEIGMSADERRLSIGLISLDFLQ